MELRCGICGESKECEGAAYVLGVGFICERCIRSEEIEMCDKCSNLFKKGEGYQFGEELLCHRCYMIANNALQIANTLQIKREE